jgi:hypothetical protein
MKYINADRLKAEIKRLQQKNDTSEDKDYPQYELDVACGYDMACDEILRLIDILQQEQAEGLHFTPLNRLIQKIPSENWNDTVNNYAKKLRDCLIKEGYRKDAEVLQGYISYMNGNNVPMATMDEQEQSHFADASKMEPEVEEEYKTWWNYISGKINVEHIMEWYMHETARHFYSLGLNARKEE